MYFELEHLRSLFENATEGFVVTDGSGKIFLVNPSACRMFDYEAKHLIGQPIDILIPDRMRKHHVQLRTSFNEKPGNRVMGHGRDLFGQNKNGMIFPVEVSLSTYLHQAERFVIAFIIDITARKSIEDKLHLQRLELEQLADEMRVLNIGLEEKVQLRTAVLQEALQQLQRSENELSSALDKERQLSEMKSRFVSMASHEFRTPLTTILSSASLAEKYPHHDDLEKRNAHINKIKNSVKHLNELLEDFLSLGKLDENKILVRLELTALMELVEGIIDEAAASRKPGQQLIYTHNGENILLTDPRLLRAILHNLISNAMKFSDQGEAIHIASQMSGDSLEMEITDKGIGIPVDEQKHLFSSFFRAANAGNIQGTGLGLHIVKKFVELLHGSITVDSQPASGTKVSLKIPIQGYE